MAQKRRTASTIREELLHTLDGGLAHRLMDQLRRIHARDPDLVVQIFLDYAAHGLIGHCRNYAMARASSLVQPGDGRYRGAFESGLADTDTAYWSVDGLIKVAGRDAYARLADFALDPRQSPAYRGNAIRQLALHGKQHFIRGFPTDPGSWREDQMPSDALREWAGAGFPEGPGFAAPLRHPSLDAPQTKLERAAARLDARLARYRKRSQDPVNPTDWLTPASPGDIATIVDRWPLPEIYIDFLRRFSPLEVTITSRTFYQGLRLYGAAGLIEGQSGYSYNPVTGEVIADWPTRYVVIANHAGDPFVLDLSRAPERDVPVLTALHGQGNWDFEVYAKSFLGFLKRLGR